MLRPIGSFNLDSASTSSRGEESLIRNVETVASYNWYTSPSGGSSRPTMIIPGCPPVWIKDKGYPMTLQPDEGRPYGDKNGCHFPKSPLQPLFLAVQKCRPDFVFDSIDVITDRCNLRQLLRWVQRKNRNIEFYVKGQLRQDGTTLVLNEYEPQKSFPAGLIRVNFEAAQTQLPKGWEGACHHYRVVSYDFAGVKLLVRHPVDIADLPTEPDNPLEALAQSKGEQYFAQHSVESDEKGLYYVELGRTVNQDSISELTVRERRTAGQNLDGIFDNVWHTLYFSQSARLFLASHSGIQFEKVDQFSLTQSPELANRVLAARSDLETVALVLRKMKELAGILARQGYPQITFRFRKDTLLMDIFKTK